MATSAKVYMNQGAAEQVVASGGKVTVEAGGYVSFANDSAIVNPNVVRSLRTRVTTANINAGTTLLAAIAGFKYRMVDIVAIAVGGSAATVTTVDVKATQGGSAVILAAFAQGSLTRSTVLHAGVSGAAVLADGASFVANDANTAITIIKGGSDLATATAIDIILTYTIEAA